MKGLRFKHHGNHPCNHGSHCGNYHDNHSNHHGNYHAEQLLFSCQCSKVSSCRVVRLSSCQVRFLGTRDMLNKFFLCPCSNLPHNDIMTQIQTQTDMKTKVVQHVPMIKFDNLTT